MIDLHCHILPAVDDGSPTIETSVRMAVLAVEQGITDILCTPHHNNGEYMNYPAQINSQVYTLQKKLLELNIPLRLYAGQEIRISGDLFERIHNGELLSADPSERYLLIEFPSTEIPGYAEHLFFSVISAGKIPVIVHPERNAGFAADPDKLRPFLNMGALTQLTAPSYLGFFGKKIQRTAKEMMRKNMIYMVASDAHNTRKRRFLLKEAYEKIEADFGTGERLRLERTAEAVFRGAEIPRMKAAEIKSKKFFFF